MYFPKYFTIIQFHKNRGVRNCKSDSFYLSSVEVKIVLRTSGIFFVSMQTNPFPDGSFLASLSAWSPSDPMKIAKAATSLLLFKILAKFEGEMP